MPLNAELARDYNDKWAKTSVDKARRLEVSLLVGQIERNRGRYEKVAATTKVPWYVIGVIHSLECGFDSKGRLRFDCHLHNGDPLAARTIHEPPNRPLTGHPPFSWEDSAIDALQYEGFDVWRDWSVAGTLYKLELYNGWGYRRHGINTPYLFGATNLYKSGKYIEIKPEGKSKYVSVFRPNLVSKQIGAAALLKEGIKCQLIKLDDNSPL